MTGCGNLIRFFLFLLNSVFSLGFSALAGATAYLLVNLDRFFSAPTDSAGGARSYHLVVLVILLLFASLALLACLGCCGPAAKSACLMKTFTALLVLFICATLGGLVFLNMESGSRLVLSYWSRSIQILCSDWLDHDAVTPLMP